jgi:hypothetical protein
MAHKGYRERSRADWGRDENDILTVEQINCGAILRIADATELMAKEHQKLVDDRNRYKRWYEQEQKWRNRAEASARSLRGVITKMKRKAGING